MANKNKLSIYLIKDEFAADDTKILKSDVMNSVHFGKADLEELGIAYFSPSQLKTPYWVSSFFRDRITAEDLFTSNARAVLITRVEMADDQTKTFALTMGYGKFMLADDVIEEDFGLKVVLNTIPPDSLRRINKINIGGNLKASNEQLPLESGIDDFGFDIDRDLIGTITGRSEDEDLATGIMTGGDLLSLTAEVDIYNLASFLRIVYSRYRSDTYKEHFAWIDHIRKVKDSRIVEKLDEKLVAEINAASPRIWMAVPEAIAWEQIKGFRYIGKEVYHDIYITDVIQSLKKPLIHVDQLKSRYVNAVSAEDDTLALYSWPAYKCVYGEVELGEKAYCINGGKWFCIDKDFVSQVNRDYDNMPVSDRHFLNCPKDCNKENEYTLKYVASTPDQLLCMDAKSISYGGGKSKIELCDVLTKDGTFIHIKPYSGSATLSHLFNQAVVSAELVRGDPQFLSKANLQIKQETSDADFLLEENCFPDVILAIISKYDVDRPPIPFFSKVALRYTKRRLDSLGCTMAIKNIRKNKS